jgi:hypothetical protein
MKASLPALEPAMAARRSRPPLSWRAIAASTFFAGSVMLLVLGLLSITVYEEPAFKILAMIAATVHGPALVERIGDFDVALLFTAFTVHFALAFLYATALACLLRDLPAWSGPWAGMAFGALLYYANLHGFTLAFGWFAELRTADTFVAHVLFGLLLGRGVPATGVEALPARRLAIS